MSLPENPYQAPDASGRAIPEADALPKLGSLAQSARGNELGKARRILFWIGGLTLVINAGLLANSANEVDQVVKHEVQANGPGFVVDQSAVALLLQKVRLIYGSQVVLGALYILFGLILRRFPIPITIASLLLYLLANAGRAVIDPTSLLGGLILKVIVIAALVKAIQAAFAYKKEEALGMGFQR